MNFIISKKLKIFLGVAFKDLWRYGKAFFGDKQGYLSICNRYERLEVAPDGTGFRCNWQWTSDLHAPKFLPFLGRRLMQRALADHPVCRIAQPEVVSEHPEISFIIGHRGLERLPHLLATLESIAGQQGVACECIVVEQDTQSLLTGKLPGWVRLIHTPPPAADMPYCRSWTFNVGARQARGELLVLHDDDILLPVDYAKLHWARIEQGYEVVNLKRFIFFLDEKSSCSLFSKNEAASGFTPESIMQNAEGGGSVAITREAYERIGGMDESFIGWGGEDNEFWERAQTCKVWPYGCLPLVHLWHPSQPGKQRDDNPAVRHYHELSTIPVTERIERLKHLSSGDMSGPNGYVRKVS